MSQIDPWTATTSSAVNPRLCVPKSSFNFAASEWTARRRERRVAIAATSVFLLLLLVAGARGVAASRSSTAAKNVLAPLKDAERQMNEELKMLSGGIEDLPGVVVQQQQVLDFAFSHDFDERALLTALQQASVSGVVLDTISVQDRTTAPNDATAKLTSTFLLQITATGSTLDSPAKWQEAMSALSSTLLEAPEVSYSVASGTSVTMTLQAGLRDDAVMSRRTNARALVGGPKTATPSTTVAP